MSHIRPRRWLGSIAIPTFLVSGMLAALAGTQSAFAQTAVADPERNSQVVTTWGWHTNATASQVVSFTNTGYRPTDIEVNSSTPTFTASYVRNSGTYARSWWWYYGLTGADIATKLSANSGRLIDIEPYSTSAGTRYAIVMVGNTGAAAKTWKYYYNVPLATITTYASANNMRVIDIDRNPGETNFSAVLIKNLGVDAKGWWHYYNVTPAQITSYINTNNARLLDFERLANGNYDVVMQSRAGEGWWWMYGATSAQVAAAANQNGARIYKIKSYVVGSTRYYDALMINNINAETNRIRNLVSGTMTGPWGFYLKKVGGAELLTLGEDNVFEPASMIKIVHAVTAMRDIQLNATTKDTLRTWNVLPGESSRYPSEPNYRTTTTTDNDDADVCAYNSNGTLNSTIPYSDKLGTVIVRQTLEQSDNRTTDALTRYYGFTGLNNTASLAGMTNSKINHRIGCNAASSPQPLTHNRLTLTDAGKIWEKVQNGTLLDATHRELLYEYAIGGVIGDGPLKSMITSEPGYAALTTAERAAFLAAVKMWSKGGSYGYCPTFGGSCSTPTWHSRTVGGVFSLPFKSASGVVVNTPYVFGRYWDAPVNCSFSTVTAGGCTAFNNNNNGMGTVSVEMFRAEVKKALATW